MDVARVRRFASALQNKASVDPSKYASKKTISVWCGTYNVNGKKEQPLTLSHWLRQGWDDQNGDWTGTAPALYCISLQEMIDLSAGNVLRDAVLDSTSGDALQKWRVDFETAFKYVQSARRLCFGASNEFPQLVALEHMVGVGLLVFARPDLLQAHQIRTARIPTGFGGGNLGNKGAVAVSLRLESTSLCVVGAHLAAHRGDVGGRNANYHSIVERDCFRRGLGWSQKEEGSRSVPSYEKNACRDGFGVLDHDVVLWLGDLNYRFQADVPDERVIELVRRKDYASLTRLDQLCDAMANTKAFSTHDFREHSLNFAPTYKYATNSDKYDFELPAEEQARRTIRCPAWCDRVLWRVAPTSPRSPNEATESVVTTVYERGDARLRASDHRPVHCALALSIRCVKDKGEVHAASVKVPSPLKGLCLEPPHASLSLTVREVQLVLRNESDAMQSWAFSSLPAWVEAAPSSGSLEPGATVSITVRALEKPELGVNRACVAALNSLLVPVTLRAGPGRDLAAFVAEVGRRWRSLVEAPS